MTVKIYLDCRNLSQYTAVFYCKTPFVLADSSPLWPQASLKGQQTGSDKVKLGQTSCKWKQMERWPYFSILSLCSHASFCPACFLALLVVVNNACWGRPCVGIGILSGIVQLEYSVCLFEQQRGIHTCLMWRGLQQHFSPWGCSSDFCFLPAFNHV